MIWGAKVIFRAFDEAGAEVIYRGSQVTVDEIADIVENEGVDVVDLSLLSGAHNSLVPKIINAIKAKRIDDVVYLLKGIILQQDIPALKEMGIDEVFGPGCTLDECIDFAFEKVVEIRAAKIVENMGTKMKSKSLNF